MTKEDQGVQIQYLGGSVRTTTKHHVQAIASSSTRPQDPAQTSYQGGMTNYTFCRCQSSGNRLHSTKTWKKKYTSRNGDFRGKPILKTGATYLSICYVSNHELPSQCYC